MSSALTSKPSLMEGFGTTRKRVWAVGAATCLLLLGVFLVTRQAVSHEREDAFARVADMNSKIALSDEVRIRSLLASLDKVLLVLREDFADKPQMSQAQLLSRLDKLRVDDERNPRVSFTDASGTVVLSSGPRLGADGRALNVSDRDYFKAQVNSQGDMLDMGVPVQSRITGQWVIPLVHRISRKDGSFGGIVFMAADPALFTETFEKTNLTPGTARALVGMDGYSRLRLSEGAFTYGGDSRTSQVFKEINKSAVGTYTAVAVADGVKRMVSYRLINPYGLIILGASSVDSIESSYRSEVNGYLTTAWLFSALILALSLALVIGVVRQKKLSDSKHSFDQLIELVPQLVFKLDLQGHIVWVNQRTLAFTGVDPEARRRGFAWVHDAIHPEDQERVKAFVSAALQGAPESATCEHRKRRADGDYLWFSARLTLILDKDGVGTSWLQTSTDIHDRKLSAERAHVMQQLESIGQLTGGMAHDFNNLLAIIVGNLDLMKPGVVEEKNARRLGVALGAAQRGVQLVKSLLALASKTPLLPTTLDLYALVEQITPLLRTALGQRIRFVVQQPLTPLSVKIDGAALEAVLLNLCVNARDAMPGGGGLVLVIDSSQGMAQLTMTDTGVGMSDEVLKRATEPFFTTKTRGYGTGLGLSMVSGFVSQSGGTMDIQSTQGKGTRIRISLPLVEPALPTPSDQEPTAPTRAKPSPCNILIVDDQPDIAALLRVWVQNDGHSAVLAQGAEEALSLLSTGVFDILLTDITMPGELDGIELAERVQAAYPKMRILLMSGYSHATAKSRADVPWPLLVKPFRKADFDALAWTA